MGSLSRCGLVALKVAYRTLPELGSVGVIVVRIVIVPMFTSIFYIAVGSSGFSDTANHLDALPAAIAVAGVASIVATPTLVSFDRFEGVSDFWTLASPLCRAAASFGRYALLVAIGVVSGVFGMAGAVVSGSLSSAGWRVLLLGVLYIVLGSVSGVGVGVAVGMLSKRMRDSLLLANVLAYGLPILVGAVSAVSDFPTWLRLFAYAIPVAHLTEALRDKDTVMGEGMWTALAIGAAWLVGASALGRLQSRRVRAGALHEMP